MPACRQHDDIIMEVIMFKICVYIVQVQKMQIMLLFYSWRQCSWLMCRSDWLPRVAALTGLNWSTTTLGVA